MEIIIKSVLGCLGEFSFLEKLGRHEGTKSKVKVLCTRQRKEGRKEGRKTDTDIGCY